MKRSLSLILAALLLAGCGGTSAPAADDTTAADASGDTTAAVTEVDLMADLPTGDFGGYEFNILGLADESSYIYVQMVSEEMNGDLINDTVFTRNQRVEEALNVEIVYTGNSAPTKTAQTSILAGNDEYDI
ncbi:MAG: lipoprotein, partial [Clostridia bacterium]|nr:lipoprotein [Clostridia bacterium]